MLVTRVDLRDDTEMFDPERAPVGAGYRLRASWGPELAIRACVPPVPMPSAEITRVVWDGRGHAAAVLRAGGDLRIWNVREWRTEQVIDPHRELIARTAPVDGDLQWKLGVELVSLAFTQDDARLIVSDPSGAVLLLTRSGEPLWRRTFAPDPSWSTGWSWSSATVQDVGPSIEARAHWRWHRGYEPDGTPVIEDRWTVSMLDPHDGRVLSHRDEPELPWRRMARAELPRIHLARGRGFDLEVRIGDATLPVPELLGAVAGASSSPGERTLLVFTKAGLLLCFDRLE
jgi:hypothetical protein